MTQKFNDGGPMFPTPTGNEFGYSYGTPKGATLWDYYFGVALQGILANPKINALFSPSPEIMENFETLNVLGAARIADAMIAGREKRVKGD